MQEAAQKGKGKKVSAAVAAMQREVEERRKAADVARQEHEEKLRADEEARLQEQREAEIQEQAEQARAEAKRLERERLRKEGKLLTAKQRAEAKRLAAQREMFLARAQVCIMLVLPEVHICHLHILHCEDDNIGICSRRWA